MLYHPKTLKRLSTHSGRLERWLGAEKIERLSNNFLHGGGPNIPWYGPPVNLCDVPGSVWIGGDGDFVGNFGRGFFASAADAMADHIRWLWRDAGKPVYLREPRFGVGFTNIADFITRQRTGYQQSHRVVRVGFTGVTQNATSLWQAGSVPIAGSAPAAAPGGTAPTSAENGALKINNPSAGTLHLTGIDFSASVINNSLMIYDRLFHVRKTMNSTATEAVTGVPTRYQSAVATDADYAGGNILQIEMSTALSATAHNWTVCTYTDEAGNAGVTLPSVTGKAAGAMDGILDMPLNTWFCPLATDDTGIKALTQMQCSALVATGQIYFSISHPIGVMMFPSADNILPFDWVTERNLGPRVFNDACLSFFELPKPSSTATTYQGVVHLVNAP